MSNRIRHTVGRGGRGGRRFGIVPILLILGAAACMPPAAQSDREEAEFGGPAPAGTGFVRVVNALPGSHPDAGAARVTVGAHGFGPIASGDVTPYRPVETGAYQVAHAGRDAGVQVREDAYLTVALTGDAVFVIDDAPQEIPRLAQLVLYNLTEWRPLDLTVIPQNITALQAVPRGQASRIAVNPIEVTLAVRLSLPQEGRTAGSRPVGTVQLREGASFGIFAYLDDEGLTATLHEATVTLPD